MPVKLIPLDINDPDQVEWIYKVRTHPDVASHFFAPPPENFKAHMQFLFNATKNKERDFFIVYSNDEPCGYCQVIHRYDSYDVGFAFHPNYWGKGLGSASCEQLIACVKNYPEKKKITLVVKKNNKRALNLYKKLGFVIINEDPNKEQFLMSLQEKERIYANHAK